MDQQQQSSHNGECGSIPTVANSNTPYTLIFTPDADEAYQNYGPATASVRVTVNKADISPSVSMEGWMYGGTANDPSVEGNTENGTVSCQYYTDADCTTQTTPSNSGASTNYGRPVYAGTYYVKAIIDPTDHYNGAESEPVSFTIARNDGTTKENLADNQKATANTLTYDGEAQALVTAPAATLPDGYTKVQYRLSGDVSSDGNWSDDIPTAVNAGDYAVQVKYVGDENHVDFEGENIPVTIAKASFDKEDLTHAQRPTANDLTYNGEAQELVTAPEALPTGYAVMTTTCM